MPAAARLMEAYPDPTQDFIEAGYHRFERPVDPRAAGRLLARLQIGRAHV